MNTALLLQINESFVEMLQLQQEKPLFQRWFSPAIPLKNKLSAVTSCHEVLAVTKLAQTIIQKKLGVSPAFLVTSGFENWLDMNIPVSEEYFTINLSRPKSPISKDYVFAINERTLADGQIRNKVDLQELEFLASKLSLNNIYTVAIGFLHSKTNPENEKLAGDFFRERGFKVFTSHECAHSNMSRNFVDSEKQRWWTAVLNAYTQPTWNDEMTIIENTLQEFINPNLKLNIALDQGRSQHWSSILPLDTIFAQEYLISNYFKRNIPPKSNSLGLYLGITNFQVFQVFQEGHQIWKSEYGPIAIRQPFYQDLFIQPTATIQEGFWRYPFVSSETPGYEPGPMCFGKSVKPTFLDSLYLGGLLDNIPGLSEQLVNKSRKRILDTFFTYSKDSLSSEHILHLGIQGIVAELNKYPNNIVYVAGPLASVILPLLKSVNSQKQFRSKETETVILNELWSEHKV